MLICWVKDKTLLIKYVLKVKNRNIYKYIRLCMYAHLFRKKRSSVSIYLIARSAYNFLSEVQFTYLEIAMYTFF